MHPHAPHGAKDYRPDVDGLRAVAVLAVLAFHGFPGWIKGGFIGVDVFFVISGYLISRIILEGLAQGTFSLAGFYQRRVGRIFPALIVVMLACYAVGLLVFLPKEFMQFGKHLAGGAGFSANLLLWREAGYFDVSAETKPLLHLWSLGIEEQFYLIWPLILVLAWKIRLPVLLVILGLAIGSFAMNLTTIAQDPVGAFYLPHTRMWELLCGALLAWFTLKRASVLGGVGPDTRAGAGGRPARRQHVLANASALTGTALLIGGLLLLKPDHRFPGVMACVPVLASMLIILAGPEAWINRRVLSHRIAVWFGLISFPLYLWHWPLLSFARILSGETPGRWVRLGLIMVAVLLAWLTYRLVEIPLRRRWRATQKTAVLVAVMVIIGTLGYITFQEQEREFRTGEVRPRAERNRLMQEMQQEAMHCDAQFPDWSQLTVARCRLQRPQGNTVAIIGDSHANHLYFGLARTLSPREGVAVFPASCAAPFIDLASGTHDPATIRLRKDAYLLINQAYEFVIRDPAIRTVLLAHNPMCSAGHVKDMANPGNTHFDSVMKAGMARSFEALIRANKQVIVLYDTPLLPHDPARCAKRPFMSGPRTERCSFDRASFDAIPAFSRYRSLVESVRTDYPQIQTYDLAELFCTEASCMIEHEGRLLFHDRDHLTAHGSVRVASALVQVIGLEASRTAQD